MNHRIYILLSITLLLGSCGYRQYQKPNVVDESSLIRFNKSGDSTYNVARIAWSDFYQDPMLQSLIEEGLADNLDLRIAMTRIEQARAYHLQSKAAFFPSLNGNLSYSQSNANAMGGPSGSWSKTADLYQAGLSASWEFDVWGKLYSARKSAYAKLLAQEASKNAIVTQLIANIAQQYYFLVALDVEKAVIQDQIESREAYLNTIKSLKASAKVNEVAVQQAEAQLQTAYSYLPDIELATRTTENTICLLLGKPSGPVKREKIDRLNALPMERDEAGVSSMLLINRPDVIAAEHSMEAYFSDVNTARAAMFPSLTISGNISTDGDKFSNWFNSPTSVLWNAIGGLTAPIFNNLKLRTQKEVAEKNFDIAVMSYRSTVLSAGMEVSNALLKTRTTTEKSEHLFKQLDALNKAYEYSLDLLVNGYATYLDVLNAQQGVLNAQLAIIQNYQDNAFSRVELYRALGGGWRR